MPPARGNIAPSSAKHNAPSRQTKPPPIQPETISGKEPASPAILPGFRKMPEPIVLPTTIAIAMPRPSTRSSSGREPEADTLSGAGGSMDNRRLQGLEVLQR